MSQDHTREKQYQIMLEYRRQRGLESFGLMSSQAWHDDPKRLTFGDRSAGKLTIKPGPNNPVGVAWIDLDIPTYGIHGAPEPRLVGKAASHGCVRLTNWDVRQLAGAVKPGVKVAFVGATDPGPTKT